jgi:hypothetical protein
MKEGVIMMSNLNQLPTNHESAIEGCYFIDGREFVSIIVVTA